MEEAGDEMLVEGRGAYRPPPRHYTPKTIDQLIVEAYGGTDGKEWTAGVSLSAPFVTKAPAVTISHKTDIRFLCYV